MRTHCGEYHLRKDFGFIDLGIPAAIGISAVAVYEVLRRFVWRSATTGNGKSRKAFVNGRLVSKITQTNIAALLGITRKTVGKHVQVLREAGWIETEGKDDEMVYVLGERLLSDAGTGVSEVFTADAICISVAERVQAEASRRGKERISEIPIVERVELVKHFLQMEKGHLVGPEGIKFSGGENKILSGENPEGKKFAENKRTLRETEEREEGTLERGPLRGDSQADPGGLTEPPNPGGDQHSRSAPAKNGNGANTSKKPVPPSTLSRAERLQLVEQRKAEAKKATQAQMEANRKRDAAKAQKMRNLKGSKAENQDKTVKRFLEKAWKNAYTEAFPEEEMGAWDGRIRGQVMQLVMLYDVGKVEAGLRYIALHWATLQARFKAKGKPSVGFLQRFHDALIPEAVQFSSVFAVKEEWDAWWRENPDDDPPEELEVRFRKLSKDMESLGLIG